MAAVVVGFMAVALPLAWPGGVVGGFVPAILLFAIPLGALGLVAGHEIKRMALFALLNAIVTMGTYRPMVGTRCSAS